MTAYRDMVSKLQVEECLRPAVATAAVDGETIDMQDADGVLFAITIGAVVGTANDASVVVEESDDDVTFTAAADTDIIGTEPTDLVPNTIHELGYIGNKRYTRLAFDPGGETSVAIAGVAVKGYLHVQQS